MSGKLPGALALISVIAGVPATGFAVADGPDFFRVAGVRAGSSLNVRAGPSTDAAVIGAIPGGADGLRNLGCVGGMTYQQYSAATPEERRAAARSRWCRVRYGETDGWTAGWLLAEGSGPPSAQEPEEADATASRRVAVAISGNPSSVLSDRIEGYDIVDYLVEGEAGQTLEVAVRRENSSLHFNVLPPGVGRAIHVGSASATPESWSGVLGDSGQFTIRVFLEGSAARRGETADFDIELSLAPPRQASIDGGR